MLVEIRHSLEFIRIIGATRVNNQSQVKAKTLLQNATIGIMCWCILIIYITHPKILQFIGATRVNNQSQVKFIQNATCYNRYHVGEIRHSLEFIRIIGATRVNNHR